MRIASEDGARWVAVARTSEVPPGQVRRVEAEGRRLALVNLEGRFYALDAVCPHQGGPLDQGKLWQGTLECPWHHHRYDPATGRNVYPADVYPDDLPELQAEVRPASTLPVRVRGETVLVGFSSSIED